MDFSDYPFDDHTCNFQVVFIELFMIIKLMSGCSGWKLFLWQKLSHLLFYIPGWPPSPPISSSTQSSPSDITILTPFNCSPFILTTLGNVLSHISNSEHYRAPKRDQIEQVLRERCSTPLTLGICHGQKELSGMRRMVMMVRGLLPTTTHKVGFWSVRGMWLPDLPPAQAPTLDLPGKHWFYIYWSNDLSFSIVNQSFEFSHLCVNQYIVRSTYPAASLS